MKIRVGFIVFLITGWLAVAAPIASSQATNPAVKPLEFEVATIDSAQQNEDQPIQLAIRQVSTEPIFQAELHNSGQASLRLALGAKYQTGHSVDALHFLLTDAQGKTATLNLQGSHLGAAGVPLITLGSGRTYSFPVDLKDYLHQSLAPGAYTLQAVYIGEDSMARVKHTAPQFWIGTVNSDPMPLIIPGGSTQQTENQPLKLTIQSVSKTGSVIQAMLHNAGDEPLLLDLGFMVGTDSLRVPLSVHLSLTDFKGETLNLQSKSPGLDRESEGWHAVIYLRPGVSYSFQFDLKDYGVGYLFNRSPTLAPGRYSLRASYVKTSQNRLTDNTLGSAKAYGPDGQAMVVDPMRPFWLGPTMSNILPISISENTLNSR